MKLAQIFTAIGKRLSHAVHGGEEGLAAKRLAAAQERAKEAGRSPDADQACRRLERELEIKLGLGL